MRLWTRLALGALLPVATGFGMLVHRLWVDQKPIHRFATEEPLVDLSRALAATAAAGWPRLEPLEAMMKQMGEERFAATIGGFTKTHVDLCVYVTDAAGKVRYDSRGRDVGADYATKNDVLLTLRGAYGARTTNDVPGDPEASTMYVAAPIVKDGVRVGVLAVGKPTRNVNALTAHSRRRVLTTGSAVGVVVILACLWFARRAVQPLAALTAHARAVRDGRPAALPALDVHEMRVMGDAFEEMRDALEGKRYVEKFVETLTHELKSPLAAIRGAAELLAENPPDERRRAFLENIRGEVERVTSLVDRLLLLSSLEARKGQLELAPLDLPELVREVAASLRTAGLARGIEIAVDAQGDGRATGERFLIRHAIENLLANALDFSPDRARVEVTVAGEDGRVRVTVRDTGSGVPAYALDRVFDRFYSLERPLTGKKSSGLGLSLVAEVARMHGGGATLANRPAGGAEATFWLARA